MIDFGANPDPELLKMILWLLFTFCGILLGITGYLINDKFRRQEEDSKRQNEVIEKQKTEIDENEKTFQQYLEDFASAQKDQMKEMSGMITAVRDTVVTLDKTVLVMQKGLEERDPRTEKRLNDHARQLKLHGERLVRIEERCKIKHKEVIEEETE